MRQAIGFPSLFLAITFLAGAQQPATRPAIRPASRSAATRAEAADNSAQLPVTRVALYKNGVGFFEHTGRVTGNRSAYELTNSNDTLLTYVLSQTNGNPQIAQAFEPILDARRRVADMLSTLDKVSVRLSALRSDEERQRSNITALANAGKGSRDRFVHDLNTTEDQITVAQKDLSTAGEPASSERGPRQQDRSTPDRRKVMSDA